MCTSEESGVPNEAIVLSGPPSETSKNVMQ